MSAQMPSTDILCRCSAVLAPGDWAGHQLAYHSSVARYACGECGFNGAGLGHVFGHCLLDGHRLDGLNVPKLLDNAPVTSGERTCEEETGTCKEDETSLDDWAVTETQVAQNSNVPMEAEAEQTVVDLQSRNESQDTKNEAGMRTFTCSKCGAVLKASIVSHRHTTVVRHVRCCLQIRPFACSKCGKRNSDESNIRKHMQIKCPGARVEKIDEERCLSALREGIRRCFPGMKIAVGFGRTGRWKRT